MRRWQPKKFKRFEKRLATSMSTSRIVTDAGKAYIKCLGNNEGPHCLACEWVGTRIAQLMGLPTFDIAILTLTSDDVPFDETGKEQAGPAFVAREEKGFAWDRSAESLKDLLNPDDVAKLIVADTLLANWDRRSPSGDKVKEDNVFLSQARAENGKVLIAMDFTHCIGRAASINSSITHINRTKDSGVYGLFDEFIRFLTLSNVQAAVQSLDRITDEKIDGILSELPPEWDVDLGHRENIRTYLRQRRLYLTENLVNRISCEAGLQTNALKENES